MVVACGRKSSTLYLTSYASDTLTIADGKVTSDLLHCRLGHMSEKGMKILHSQENLSGIFSMDLGMCEDCKFRKQKRVSFQKGGRPPKARKLELEHNDIWGPATVSSLGNSSYFVTFIDDYSRKVWVY